MSFLLNSARNPSYTYREGEGKIMVEGEPKAETPPKEDEHTLDDSLLDSSEISSFSGFMGPKKKMLVSIGSGVSMIKVDSVNGKFERVSGTMIGGGTLVGLSNLLTGINNFEEIVEMAQKGDNGGVDMLVKDIYGDRTPSKEL